MLQIKYNGLYMENQIELVNEVIYAFHVLAELNQI